MQALGERIERWLDGAGFEGYEPLGFSGLKTYDRRPTRARRRTPRARRAAGEVSVLVVRQRSADRVSPLAGGTGSISRSRRSTPSRRGRLCVGGSRRWPRSAVARARDRAQGRLVGAGARRRRAARGTRPRSTSDEFAEWVRDETDGRRIHTILRDQRTVAGVGRGYADDILHRAKLSPYASLKSLDADERSGCIAAIHEVLAEGLERERLANRRPVAEQARRALHRARKERCAVPGVRRRISSVCRTSRTRSCTARRVRPEARCLPTAACRGSSNDGSAEVELRPGLPDDQLGALGPSGERVRTGTSEADCVTRLKAGASSTVVAVPCATKTSTNGAAGNADLPAGPEPRDPQRRVALVDPDGGVRLATRRKREQLVDLMSALTSRLLVQAGGRSCRAVPTSAAGAAIRLTRVLLRVADAAPRADALRDVAAAIMPSLPSLSRCDERAVEHPGDDLHVAVRMRAEAAAGRDHVVVQYEQQTVVRVVRVVVLAEAEAVPRVEPRDLGMEAGARRAGRRSRRALRAQVPLQKPTALVCVVRPPESTSTLSCANTPLGLSDPGTTHAVNHPRSTPHELAVHGVTHGDRDVGIGGVGDHDLPGVEDHARVGMPVPAVVRAREPAGGF